MANADINWIANFIGGIADDVLRDLYVRGKYRDVILPMIVLRRLDSVLGPTKQGVLTLKDQLDSSGIVNQEGALKAAAGQPFFNTSRFSLRDMRSRGTQQQLLLDFQDYLDGYSDNVQDILVNFDFRNQLPKLSKADALGGLISKFYDPSLRIEDLDNHAMGSVFEELVRRFNEENNEEAGEHWTPRDAVKLMANLIFRPIADQIQDGTYLLYDGVIGTGGMLTVAQATLEDLSREHGKQVSTHLYGQEINAETYAICKADLLLSGGGAEADNIVGGPEHSTLSHDAFRGRQFDFLLSNPPYGKSWKTDLERLGGKSEIRDPRFVVNHAGDPAFSLVTRSSDGQMLFLANMIAKMKQDTVLGSRIAEVHSGSSLFTGDAGQGESNIRRWIIENDWLESIVQLPLNIFYNTGIATYIWVLSNRKSEERRGKVQLIDASGWCTALRRNLGQKSCELSPKDIETITSTFLNFVDTEQCRILPNEYFGYRKIKIERPLRLRSQLRPDLIDGLAYASGDHDLRRRLHGEFGDDLFRDFAKVRTAVEEFLNPPDRDEDEVGEAEPTVPAAARKRLLDEKKWTRDARLRELARDLTEVLGGDRFDDFNVFSGAVKAALKARSVQLTAGDLKALLLGVSWRDEEAPPVIKKESRCTDEQLANPLVGVYLADRDGRRVLLQYEADSQLTDFEQVPLLDEGGVDAFVMREVLPYWADAWREPGYDRVGYEVSFARHFHKPAPTRPVREVEADIRRSLVEGDGLVLRALDGAE